MKTALPEYISYSGKENKPFQVVVSRPKQKPIWGGRFRTIEEATQKRNQIISALGYSL